MASLCVGSFGAPPRVALLTALSGMGFAGTLPGNGYSMLDLLTAVGTIAAAMVPFGMPEGQE
jgi:hypothetical protein